MASRKNTKRPVRDGKPEYVTPVEGNPDEPCFHGELWGDRVHPPKYEIHVKL